MRTGSAVLEYSCERWWHDDADVQKFKNSQGKTGTYLLRLTDWSSHGVLDSGSKNGSMNGRVRSFSEENFQSLYSRSSNKALEYESENHSKRFKSHLHPHVETFNTESLQRWRLLEQEEKTLSRKLRSQGNSLKYTSSILKQTRRKIRIITHMSQNSLFCDEELDSDNEPDLRSRSAPPKPSSIRSKINRSETIPTITDSEESASQIEVYNKGDALRKFRNTRWQHEIDNAILSEIEFQGNNFLIRRFSVRGTRIFNRRRNIKFYPENDQNYEELPTGMKRRSFSLPALLPFMDFEDNDFWRVGFVQSRVQKLEKDLANHFEDLYFPCAYEFEVQSLCSLDMGKIVPDDYRIAYVSSLETSLESNLDYMEDAISAFGTGTLDAKNGNKASGLETLDIKRNKKYELSDEDDWNLSFSSSENKENSSEEDEFYFFLTPETVDSENTSETVLGQENDSFTILDEKTKLENEQTNINDIVLNDFPNVKLACNIENTRLNFSEIITGEKAPTYNLSVNFMLKEISLFKKPIIFKRNRSFEDEKLEFSDIIRKNKTCLFCKKKNVMCIGESIKYNSISSKIEEIYYYEPLVTPFSEIYAITYGKLFTKTFITNEEMENSEIKQLVVDLIDQTLIEKSSEKKLYLDNPSHSQQTNEDDFMKIINFPSYPESSINLEVNLFSSGAFYNYVKKSNLKFNSRTNTEKKWKKPNEIKDQEISKVLSNDVKNIIYSSFLLNTTNNIFNKISNPITDFPKISLISEHEKLLNERNVSLNDILKFSYKNFNHPQVINYSIFMNNSQNKAQINSFRQLKEDFSVYTNPQILIVFSNHRAFRNRNFLNEKVNLSGENEILKGEMKNEVGRNSESGFCASRRHSHRCVTSQTGGATFVECFLPPESQYALVGDQSETRLPPGSVLQITVPAVQRVAKRENHSAENECTVLCVSNVADGTCRRNRTDWIKRLKCDTTFFKGLHPILDYAVIDCFVLDYNHEDYVLPAAFTLLIANDCFDLRNGENSRYSVLQWNMATLGDEIRSVNRVVRTEGKNISKLKKFFDSPETSTKTRADDNSFRKFVERKTSTISSQSEIMSNESPNSVYSSQEKSSECKTVINNVSSSSNDQVSENNSTHINSNVHNSSDSLSDIPFCRKVTKGSLWDNVDIGNSANDNEFWRPSDDNHVENGYSVSNSSSELQDLIAASRSELSKIRDQAVSDKSNLESYFTSFENSKSMSFETSDLFNGDQRFFSSTYDCDMNDISFDDEDAVLSDVSSDEEMRGHPALSNTNYLPAYALHTIIEESCEESERDSRTATPTNNTETSKLERYFSWDIINDTELNLRKKEDDESTIYSDSLSEGTAGDTPKEVDPTHLVSSRLEKYFTSGLVDDDNYYYPDDAEYPEDPPVSDFEEDSVHQKISRSALLNSLESNHLPPKSDDTESPENEEVPVSINLPSSTKVETDTKTNETFPSVCDKHNGTFDISPCIQLKSRSAPIIRNLNLESDRILDDDEEESIGADASKLNKTIHTYENVSFSDNNANCDFPQSNSTDLLPDDITKDEAINLKHISNKQQIAADIQSIIQKLVSHFSADSLKDSIETDYTSAWQMLETEIERLLNTISPSALEHNSCNSSLVDSNNSDYGSDTIESIDCMTDDDDCVDSKNRNAKCPLVDMLRPFKVQTDCDLNAFNISDETLGIWKRLIQSLQKDNIALAKSRTYDPNAEARLYIKNQIVTLMHTVTVNDANVQDIEKVASGNDSEEKDLVLDEQPLSEELNEAFNVSITNSNILTGINGDEVIIPKIESSDEGISSTDSNENIHLEDESMKLSRNVTITEEMMEGDSSMIQPSSNSNNMEKSDDSLLNSAETLDKESSKTPDSSTLLHQNNKTKFSDGKMHCKENDLKFSVVDIELDDNVPTVAERKMSSDSHCENDSDDLLVVSDDLALYSSNETLSKLRKEAERSQSVKTSRNHDIGYFSYKSCDDSLLHTPSPSSDIVDVPNFKSLKRSIKKFPPPSSTLSKSTNNIFQTLSSDMKFSTLQSKSKKSKSSSQSPSRQFTSLFSPSSVIKRITGTKSSEAQTSDSTIPAKYLKKYAKTTSVENDKELFGAVSMPHLNAACKPGDSYSALGLYSENDPDNSMNVDDEVDARRYFSGSQSVLSLGSHSASMTSVYSAGGCHYGYVTISGDVLFGLNYNQKSQMMEVFVKQCRNLAASDARNNKSNPYVKVYLLPDKTRSGKRKTKTKKNTLNPVFNELLRFPVLKNELESRTLWLTVWNSDLFGRNDFLGEISLPLGYRLLDSPTLRWYPLQERAESLTSPLNYRGELFIALKYVPRDLSLESRFRPAPVISVRGALHVLVKEARNISTNNSSSPLDAFCKSYLLPDKSKSSKQKTPIVKKSRHPKWYYTVIYEDLSVDDLRERSLELTVWDYDKITSNHFLGGVRLNTGSGLYHGVPVDWMDSRRDESSLWQSMLESPNMWVDGCLPLRPTLHSHLS
nr:uncharacterized protein LOC107436800 isoform X2 [Parasteatoda tepidariorum]